MEASIPSVRSNTHIKPNKKLSQLDLALIHAFLKLYAKDQLVTESM